MKKGSWFIVHGSWLKLILFIVLLFGCQAQQLYKDNRVMMGTFIEVTSPDKNAPGIVFAEIERIEGLLSRYKESSEVSKLNRLGKLNASNEVFYIIKKAKEFWQMTDGAFDITVAPLMDLWGFTDKKYRLPQAKEIKANLALIGSDKIILHDKNNLVEFKTPGMKIDLGAIAKGYALDCAVKKLKEKGIKSCLINAGGQIYCLGSKFGRPWNIAIRNPAGRDFVDYLDLKDKAVATSGDYEQYFDQKNRRYGHIFNPKSGYPAESQVISVTIVAPDGLTADALATSIFVLGKVKGQELSKKFPDVSIRIF